MVIKDLPWQPIGRCLDPYAGNKKWWKGSSTSPVFVDRFYNLPNTIKASICSLPFSSGVFDCVFADPPHFIRKSRFAPSCKLGHFGAYKTRQQVHDEWTRAAVELWRVTKPGAFLVWKTINGAKTKSQCVDDSDLFTLMSAWDYNEDIRQPSRVGWSSAETVYSHWTRKDTI